MTTAACLRRHHSPTFNGKTWSCPSCLANLPASPLSKVHAEVDRRKKESR